MHVIVILNVCFVMIAVSLQCIQPSQLSEKLSWTYADFTDQRVIIYRKTWSQSEDWHEAKFLLQSCRQTLPCRKNYPRRASPCIFSVLVIPYHLDAADSCYLYFYVLPPVFQVHSTDSHAVPDVKILGWQRQNTEGHHNYCLCSRRRGFVGPLVLYTQPSAVLMAHWVPSYLLAPFSCLWWNPHLPACHS